MQKLQRSQQRTSPAEGSPLRALLLAGTMLCGLAGLAPPAIAAGLGGQADARTGAAGGPVGAPLMLAQAPNETERGQPGPRPGPRPGAGPAPGPAPGPERAAPGPAPREATPPRPPAPPRAPQAAPPQPPQQ
ncbi:hypothetical protein, partial [Rhodovulum sp. PH10]|uniref:hypothetical protein n=1 Tax=Rhodovulum sp. PH10 TaxID=1187851 RepID=UPI003FCFC345